MDHHLVPKVRCGMSWLLEYVLPAIGLVVVVLSGLIVWERYFGKNDPHG